MPRSLRLLSLLILVGFAALMSFLIVPSAEAQILGTNWTGTFYQGTSASGTIIAENMQYPTGLCFNWGQSAPTQGTGAACQQGAVVPGAPADNFSAVFNSTQSFAQAGIYRFTIRVDDAVRFYVDGVVVLDRFTQTNALVDYTVDVNLSAGNHTLRVDYAEFIGTAILQVQWGFVGVGAPTATPVPAATGQVVRVRGLAVRTGPYLGASLIRVARPNNTYTILERNRDEGLFVWYKIVIGDNQGWVSGRYFEVSGNIDAIPFTQTVFDQIDNAPSLGIVGVTTSVMNLRRRPSERAQLLDKVPWGGEVDVIGRTVQGGNSFWVHVRYNDKVGWIWAPYVKIRGLVDALPVR